MHSLRGEPLNFRIEQDLIHPSKLTLPCKELTISLLARYLQTDGDIKPLRHAFLSQQFYTNIFFLFYHSANEVFPVRLVSCYQYLPTSYAPRFC